MKFGAVMRAVVHPRANRQHWHTGTPEYLFSH
jgi:hypothetical protein